ncbi:MAG: MarR family transcriptional regulator [Ardenticatenaceae bacterium]|nr:MarR family transcriptional regulator [Ardenticatenaceae bacterium]MCB8973411.1 MarR family transcriptional regulator [Ardenticatenaceae bacterium]
MKAKIQIGVTVLSLMALLTYTLVHTGGLLARYVHPEIIGYVAAFGIEAAVVSLSLRIGELRRTRQSPGFFLFVLIAVVVVSAVANIAEGFTAVQGAALTLATVRTLDPVQAFIGLAATGLVSLIVLALAEILGTDVETAVKQADKERKRQPVGKPVSEETAVPADSPKPGTAEESPSIERARAAKAEKDALSRAEAMQLLLIFVAEHPDASLSRIGRHINRSKTTVSNYVQELQEAGQLQRNGDGWQVQS